MTFVELDRLKEQRNSTFDYASEVKKRMKVLFPCQHAVGTSDWRLDVRRFVADRSKSTSKLIPPRKHILLRAARVKFIVFKYWSNADKEDVSLEIMQVFNEEKGFTEEGYILLEREEDLKAL